jgi:hypothetical protein
MRRAFGDAIRPKRGAADGITTGISILEEDQK